MSIISFPRRVETVPRRSSSPAPTRTRRAPAPVVAPSRPRHAAEGRRQRLTPVTKAMIVLFAAVLVSVGGMVENGSRQVELHSLQSQLLQDQSAYAQQVGSVTNLSAPSVIATQATSLHLVDPSSVSQVPSTSLDAILALPKFVGYAPVTSRTLR